MIERSFVQGVIAGLVRAWRSIGPKPSRPEFQGDVDPDEGPVVEARPLGAPAAVGVKPKARREELPFDPSILAVRVSPWQRRRPPGELRMPVAARDAMRGEGDEGPPLVVDPTPQAPEPRWELQEKKSPIVPREREAKHWSRGGYRWPRFNDPAMEECRRQLLLRTDLARLKYPRLPSPGRLMRPMLEVDFALEPWVPLSDEPHIELTSEDLTWWRFTDQIVGAPPRPRPQWRSAVAQAEEAQRPEVEGDGELSAAPKSPAR